MYHRTIISTSNNALKRKLGGVGVEASEGGSFVRQHQQRRWHNNNRQMTDPLMPPPPPSRTQLSYLTFPKAFAVGGAAGVMGSLAGMGGGFVMIPLMTSGLLRLTQHQAHGTSLFAVAATGVAGALGYSDQVQWENAAAVAACGMVTARMGARATSIMSERALKKALGFLMLVMGPAVPAKAYYMEMHEERLQQQQRERVTDRSMVTIRTRSTLPYGPAAMMLSPMEQEEERTPSLPERLLAPGAIGMCSGFLAGLFGVGGGTIVVPMLTMATDCSHHEALATSLAAMTLPAISGTMTHYSAGNVAMRVAPALAMGAFCGAYLGGKLGLQLDEEKLRWGFSGVVGTLGLRTILRA